LRFSMPPRRPSRPTQSPVNGCRVFSARKASGAWWWPSAS